MHGIEFLQILRDVILKVAKMNGKNGGYLFGYAIIDLLFIENVMGDENQMP